MKSGNSPRSLLHCTVTAYKTPGTNRKATENKAVGIILPPCKPWHACISSAACISSTIGLGQLDISYVLAIFGWLYTLQLTLCGPTQPFRTLLLCAAYSSGKNPSKTKVDLLIMTWCTSPDCFALTLRPLQWLITQFRATTKKFPISEHHGLKKKTTGWLKIKTFITVIIPTKLKKLICQMLFTPCWGSTSKPEAPTTDFHRSVALTRLANNRLGLSSSGLAELGFYSCRDKSIQVTSSFTNQSSVSSEQSSRK